MNQHHLPPVLCIGITGGIGCGKSYICKQLENAGHTVFYCDTEAKRIIRTQPEVMDNLRQLVGQEVYNAEGQLVKPVLASFLCKGKNYSRQVDAIVHPRVAQAFQQRHEEAVRQLEQNGMADDDRALPDLQGEITLEQLCSLPPQRTLFMECALLFESGFDILTDVSVLIHVSAETQISRLMERDHLTREQALSWIGLQLSEEEKMKRCSAFLVNE